MKHQEDLTRLISRIRSKHKYDDPLPEKAVHKLLFFADKEARKRDIPLSVPYFWYRYGTLSPLPSPATEPTNKPRGGITDDDLDLLASTVLDQYYGTSLEELTDLMYEFTPYQVQQDWRVLDKKLRTHHSEYHNFYEVNPSRESIRESSKAVYENFPVEQHPRYEGDLTRWYSAITRELYNDEMSVERMMEVNTAFWGTFSITLARNHRHEIDLEGVKRVLSVDSLEAAHKQRRQLIRKYDSEGVTDKFAGYTPNDVEERAVEALAGTVIK